MTPDAKTAGPSTADADHFIRTLEAIEDGRLVAEAAIKMRELSQKMTRHRATSGGKPKGKLTITINLTLDNEMFDVVADVGIKEPRPVRPRSIMYTGRDGALVPNDPKQISMDLQTSIRGIDAPAATRPRAV